MAEQEWAADQIEVTVAGFFTTHHCLKTSEGSLGELTIPTFRRSSVFRGVDGRELVARQTRWWKQEYELLEGGTVLGTAWLRGIFRRDVVVRFAGQQYTLRPVSLWKRNWQLIDPAGVSLLEVRPRGVFRRGAYLVILAGVSVELLVFTYYVVHKSWETESAAAHAAAS